MKHIIVVVLCLLFQAVPMVAQQTSFSEKKVFIINQYDAQGFITQARAITFSSSDKSINKPLSFRTAFTTNRNANIVIYELDSIAFGNFSTRTREVKYTKGNLLTRHYRGTQNVTLVRQLTRRSNNFFLPFARINNTNRIIRSVQVQRPTALERMKYFPVNRHITSFSYDRENVMDYFFRTNTKSNDLIDYIDSLKNGSSQFKRLNSIFLDLDITQVQAVFISQADQNRFLPIIQAQFPDATIIPTIDITNQLIQILATQNTGRKNLFSGVVHLTFRGVPK